MSRSRKQKEAAELINEAFKLFEEPKPKAKRERAAKPAPVVAAPKKKKAPKKKAKVKAIAPTFVRPTVIPALSTHAVLIQEFKKVETTLDLLDLATAAEQVTAHSKPNSHFNLDLDDIIHLGDVDSPSRCVEMISPTVSLEDELAVQLPALPIDNLPKLANDASAIVNYPNALHCAVYTRDNLKLAELLNTHAIDVNGCDHAGFSPLYIAVLTNNVDAVKLLLDAGADKNLVGDAKLESPYNVALFNKDLLEIYEIFAAHNGSLVPKM